MPELKKRLRDEGLSPHKTSLYRNLEKLVANGSVNEVLLDSSSAYYESAKAHHHHALCNLCSRVFCVAGDIVEKGVHQLERAVKKNGFAPAEHHIVLHGTCKPCQK